jgi:uncharacterized protein YigA (DUF484 family)
MPDRDPAPRPAPNGPSAADVADFLARTPEFLAQNPHLLAALTPPDARGAGDVLDFQRFAMAKMQADLARIRGAHDEIVAAGRANLSAQGRVHAAALALLGARTLDHLVEVATVDLAVHLEVDAVVLGFEALEIAPRGARAEGLKLFAKGRLERWIPPGRDAQLAGPVQADAALFGGAATLVRSQALLRLQPTREGPAGILALGARDPAKFQPGQGTELLGFLARVLEFAIRGWLERG